MTNAPDVLSCILSFFLSLCFGCGRCSQVVIRLCLLGVGDHVIPEAKPADAEEEWDPDLNPKPVRRKLGGGERTGRVRTASHSIVSLFVGVALALTQAHPASHTYSPLHFDDA